ncbi:MAG: alpha/beta hydrolase, partial [Gammaproteobacteria bacterium]|nr:alpha/beta hydrolase [Gammaproteobacteria bacterium]NIT15308.1 alpha/beta hydrolase [Gammaproteobacteria bacterium]
CEERDIGVIAGTVPLGFGKLVADFDEPNDGTIAVSETRLKGARDHLVMAVSHKGMLVSPDVADQAAAFLRRGEFLRED